MGYLPDYPAYSEPEPEEKPKDRVTPIDKLKLKFPELRALGDDKAVDKMHEIFPEVPLEKLAVYVKQPDGMKLIEDELGRGLTPLEKFKKLYPAKATGKSDDEIIDYLHQTLEPFTDKDTFKEKINPPPPVINALKARAFVRCAGHLRQVGTVSKGGDRRA